MSEQAAARRLPTAGSLLLVGALIAANTAVFLVVQRELHGHLDGLGDERRQLIAALARGHDSATLADILDDLGVQARVTDPQGEQAGTERGAAPDPTRDPIVAAPVPLADGGVAEAVVPRDGIDRVMTSLVLAQLLAVPVVVLLSVIVVRRVVAEARATRDRSRRFLADAAHQMRTPVAAAMAASQTLLWDIGTYTPADRERLLIHVQCELARSGRVVDRLLMLATLDDDGTIDLRPVDIVTLVASEVSRQRVMAPELSLIAETGETPVFVSGAAPLLRDALSNLIDNARRHARSTIVVSLRSHAGRVAIAVADDGPGPTRPSEQLFMPFATFGPHGGSGLGLAVTRAVARAHGGDAEFRDGRFVIRLPGGASPSRSTLTAA